MNLKTIKSALGFLCLVFLFFSPCALAQVLKIETIDVPPFGFFDEAGKETGLLYDIANRVAENAGFQYSNKIIPYARTRVDIETGDVDMVIRIGNDRMNRYGLLVIDFFNVPIVVIGQAKAHFSSVADLNGKTIGTLRYSTYREDFDKNKDIIKFNAKNYVQLMKMLKAGHLDGVIGTSIGIYYSCWRSGISMDEFGKPLIVARKNISLFVSRKTISTEKIKLLQQAAEKLIASGEIEKITEKYMPNRDWVLPETKQAVSH